MEWFHSVRLKILFGFVMLIAPLVFFLFYNDYYAMDVVHEQVSNNYESLLKQYSENTDNLLEETSLYLYRFVNDPDFTTLYASDMDTNDYVLTKIRIQNKLSTGIGYYHIISSLFTYSSEHNDFILANADDYSTQNAQIYSKLPELIDNDPEAWRMFRTSQGNAMVRTVTIAPDFIAGVWIGVDKFLEPLQSWSLGEGGGVFLTDGEGNLLTPLHIAGLKYESVRPQVAALKNDAHLLSRGSNGKQYLIVKEGSAQTGIHYVLLIPEKSILRSLPYFQKTLVFISFAVLLVLLLYIFLLQKVFIRPMSELIRGMRRIGQGKLDVRLPVGNKGEFALIKSAFNDMAGQIESLKINVYEEKLRVQQAEYKHLQVQINPHFYMNSLNIIYNLAAMRDHHAVKKMALHLADYFRFIIHTNKKTVTLEEELKHILNYLEIHTLRYPDNLSYEIDVPEHLAGFLLPPLTVQPFVENAIIHGFKDRKSIFAISITARQDEAAGQIRIMIRDSGVGFPQEWLEQVGDPSWYESQGDHIGIWNVLRRLQMYYGSEAEVIFRNAEQGAEVILSLPRDESTKEEEAADV